MAEEEVAEFLTHLARNLNVAASTQNQALSALLFLYKEVLKREIGWLEKVERANRHGNMFSLPRALLSIRAAAKNSDITWPKEFCKVRLKKQWTRPGS